MNKTKSIIMMAMFAIVAVFSACSDDGYWNQYVEPQAEGAKYSFAQAKSVNSLDASETSVTLLVTRTETAQADTVPVTVKVSDEKLIAPESVTFEAGKASAEYVINFSDLVIGETYTATVSLDSAVVSAVGNPTCAVTLKLNYTWVSLGKGLFEDYFMFENPYEVEILQAEGFDIYRVMHPYDEGLVAEGYVEGGVAGTPAEYIEIEVDEDGMVYYEEFATGYLYQGDPTLMVKAYHPFNFYEDSAAWVHNVQVSEGVFQLAPYYYIIGVGGWNQTQNDGVITITLPSAIK